MNSFLVPKNFLEVDWNFFLLNQKAFQAESFSEMIWKKSLKKMRKSSH